MEETAITTSMYGVHWDINPSQNTTPFFLLSLPLNLQTVQDLFLGSPHYWCFMTPPPPPTPLPLFPLKIGLFGQPP